MKNIWLSAKIVHSCCLLEHAAVEEATKRKETDTWKSKGRKVLRETKTQQQSGKKVPGCAEIKRGSRKRFDLSLITDWSLMIFYFFQIALRATFLEHDNAYLRAELIRLRDECQALKHQLVLVKHRSSPIAVPTSDSKSALTPVASLSRQVWKEFLFWKIMLQSEMMDFVFEILRLLIWYPNIRFLITTSILFWQSVLLRVL